MASLGSALVVALMITWCVEGLFVLLTSALLAVLSLFINVRSALHKIIKHFNSARG